MQSNEQVVYNSIIENTPPDLVKVDEGDFIQLKNAAEIFIQKVEDMINRMKHTEMTINGSTIKKGIQDFYKFMRQSSTFTQEALVLQHTFETQLNGFLGRTIYLTWVSDDGHMLFFDNANIGKVYANVTANRGRGNISASKMKQIGDINDLEDTLQKKIQQSQQLRSHVYQVAVARWSSNSNEGVKAYNPSNKTFYWRLHDNYHITGWTDPISSKGVIAQGYAGAVINEDPNVISSNLQNSLKVLYENHIQKDSLGAAVKGDVVLDSNGHIQFAVKEGSFSTARFGQYLNLAYNTLQIKQISVEEYKQYLPKLVRVSKVANNIIRDINLKVEQEVNHQIATVAPLS